MEKKAILETSRNITPEFLKTSPHETGIPGPINVPPPLLGEALIADRWPGDFRPLRVNAGVEKRDMVKAVDENASPSGIRILGEVKDGRSDLATISVEYNPGELKVLKGREEVFVKNCAI